MIPRKMLFTFLLYFVGTVVVTAFPDPGPIKRVGKQLEEYTLPVAKIFEVDQANRVLRQWTKINEKSETVLEGVDKIRLECTSDDHPVQWLYFGHGAPILTSNVTFSRVKSRNAREAASTEYVATALINPAKEHHTGKYICSGTDHFDMRTYFYIYVPGPTLFSALNGQDIYIPKNDSRILIPCTVSNPDVIVTLEKSINDVLQRVKPSLVSYDPTKGATLDISEIDDPEGIYVCTARYNNLVRGIEYTLHYPSSRPLVYPENMQSSDAEMKEEAPCDLKCGENARCERSSNGQQSCVCNHQFKGNPSDACVLECRSHSDCPSNTVCFSDLKCRDPCIHSIRCGPGALCRVDNAFPVCFCPENFVGDPKTGCIDTIQQDSPPASLKNVTSSPEVSQCNRKCGDNAICVISKGKETCKCTRGQVECDIPCESHDDCPDDLSCNVLRKCHSPCIHNIRCGNNAKCETISHRPKCYCPRDSIGDPMKECTSGYQGDEAPASKPDRSGDASPAPGAGGSDADDKCKRDRECASHEKCMKAGVDKGKQCLDPCLTRRCGTAAVCKTQDHRVFCACKDGFEGNANKECRPIKYEDGAVEPLRAQMNCTRPEACGPNSKCTLDKDGRQKCECLEGHIGDPPNCSVECELNSDCPSNQLCLRDSRLTFPYCAKVCGKKICGVNSMCREANGVIAADCECPVGYGGDAYLRCQNLNDKIGQECVMDEECGSSLRCETGATFRKCVDPCTKLKCSENLECAVRDHLPTCVCQSGYTGNPNIGCTKDVDFNVTALKENPCGGLSCGPHSECRFVNGQPSCSCRSYARGEPPSCYQECRANSDCELGLSCVQKQCRHSCERCGNNTKCLISRNPRQESVCTCLDGFEGNPKVECKPVQS